MYLARERKSKFVVAIKAISKKEVARGSFADLIQNEIDVQTHLSFVFAFRLCILVTPTFWAFMATFGTILAFTW